MQRILPWFLAFSGMAACLACGDGTSAPPGASVWFAATAADGCQRVPGDSRKAPADVDRVVVTARDAEGAEVATAVATAARLAQGAEVLLEGVPPGTVRLEVAGCQGAAATWWGVDPAVVVEASQKSAPVVFLLPVQGLACVGGPNRNPLAPGFQGDDFVVQGRSAFAAAAAGPDGTVLLAGGASELGLDGRLKGGTGLWRYLPESGLFVAARNGAGAHLALTEGRLGHGLAFLGDGRAAVFGGASEAVVAPTGFPGAKPPLLPDLAPQAALELVDLAAGTSVAVAGVTAPNLPSVAVDALPRQAARAFAMAGGLASGGVPSDALTLFPATDPAAVAAGTARTAKLAQARFGGTARFLSTGDLLLVGGWDGTASVAPELVRVRPDGLSSRLLLAGHPPADGAASAFPAVAVLEDSGTLARVLVVGGNPLESPSAWNNPDIFAARGLRAAWVLTLHDADADGAYDFDGFEVETLPTGDAPWTARSFAALVPFEGLGSVATGRFLAAGGYRSFSTLSDKVTDCLDAAGKPMGWCFPSTLAAFTLGAAGLSTAWEDRDLGRLGATVVSLGPATVLVAGGLSGFGGSDPGSYIESTGVVAFAGGLAADQACADHPAPSNPR